jgi:hypothetical protein
MKILIRESQLKSIIKEYGNGPCDFFKDITNRPDYDDVLQNKPDRHFKDLSGEIVLMGAEEYLRRCSTIQGVSYDEIVKIVNPVQVEKVLNAITRGIKLDLPMIDYVNKFQEGRHRMTAASELGCNNVKVAIFYKKETEDEDGIEFRIGDYNWSDVDEDEKGQYIKINMSDHKKIESVFGEDSIDALYDVFYPFSLDLQEGEYGWSVIKDISLLEFDGDNTNLVDFLLNEITNNITQSELVDFDYDYNLETLVNDRDLYEILTLITTLKRETEYFNKLYTYLVKLFDGVITFMVKEHNNYFVDHIKDGYDVDYVKDNRELTVKIYDHTTHNGNPKNYNYAYEILSEDGGIVNYEFIDKQNFVDSNDKIDLRVVNLYLNKFPFKK